MRKDLQNNEITKGTRVLFNGFVYTVIDIDDSIMIAQTPVSDNFKVPGQTLKVPFKQIGKITLQTELTFEVGQILNMYVLKDPEKEYKEVKQNPDTEVKTGQA